MSKRMEIKAWLDRAWKFRKHLMAESEALRVFHGPGEEPGGEKEALSSFAIDRFRDHYWLTEWEGKGNEPRSLLANIRGEVIAFLKTKGAKSVVGLSRPERGIAPVCQTFWGEAPHRVPAQESCGGKFWIQLSETRHPGLFLDHEPLRRWLSTRMQGLRVLNTFAYTGSLSVGAARGGASHVTTLDLSKPSIEWAKENFALNDLPLDPHRWIFGDVFEWLPRLKREKQSFDCVILDPPSFSRSKKKQFSTGKDLVELHSLAMELLSPGGYLVTSINSANVTWKKFEADVLSAARAHKKRFQVVSQIQLPESFPTPLGLSEAQYLKGWILREG